MLVNNFRPVSALPLSSMILEQLMYFRILSFFNQHNLFYKYQFGFRERHGTDIALIDLIDKIMSALNEGDLQQWIVNLSDCRNGWMSQTLS